MSKKIYAVTSYRLGSHERHSYTIGIFDSKEKAVAAAMEECEYRGGNYQLDVEEFELNHYNVDDDSHWAVVHSEGRWDACRYRDWAHLSDFDVIQKRGECDECSNVLCLQSV